MNVCSLLDVNEIFEKGGANKFCCVLQLKLIDLLGKRFYSTCVASLRQHRGVLTYSKSRASIEVLWQRLKEHTDIH